MSETTTREPFRPERYRRQLSAIISACAGIDRLDDAELQRILRRHPKDGDGFFSRSELIAGVRLLASTEARTEPLLELLRRLRLKPMRTRSGVAPVTVLTQPFPCPGRCIFCPSDVRMPKSYLSSEPGARRAAQHRFDPYGQTASRLAALHAIGHPVEKVELIVLGGTWTFYPETYQTWFIARCFDAMNDFGVVPWIAADERNERSFAFEAIEASVDGRATGGGTAYNRAIDDLLESRPDARPAGGGDWDALEAAHRRNETALARCVGLSLETRPDQVDEIEVLRLRRLGATKIQIGYQSLDDAVLALNRRGHTTEATRRAMLLLRGAGFKIQAHWMPNLHGSDPRRDLLDYERVFGDPAYRPDELKLYPTSLVETAELMEKFLDGSWQPYPTSELTKLLEECLLRTPPYCRLSRVIRDIPSTDIVEGNKTTNLRQVAEAALAERGLRSRDIRAREIGDRVVRPGELRLEPIEYDTAGSREVFLQYVTADDRLAGFLRLSLPAQEPIVPELTGSAIVREVHVYGDLMELGETSTGAAQHRGLGRELMAAAAERAARSGHGSLAVISAIGTREYYRKLGFTDGTLYQHRRIG